MDNTLYFIYGSTIKEKTLRSIILIFSITNFFLFSVDFIISLNFLSGLTAVIMLLLLFFFFPRVSYISIFNIENGFVKTNRWYTSKTIRKFIGKINFNRSFQLLNLDRVEIQYLGLISKIGKINFISTDKKKESILFSPLHISSDHINGIKRFFSNFKVIETDVVNNLVILLEHFSYDFDLTEFYQFESKNYLYFVILAFLWIIPVVFFLNI